MRIHDISLVADLTTYDPNDPYPCDGTNQGIESTSHARQFATSLVQSVISNTISEWLGSWPTLKTTTLVTFDMGIYCKFVWNCDILQDASIEEFVVDIPAKNSIDETQYNTMMEENWFQFFSNAFPPAAVLAAAIDFTLWAINDFIGGISKVPTLQQIAIYAILFIVFCGLNGYLIAHIYDGVISGSLDYGVAFGICCLQSFMYCYEGVTMAKQYLKWITDLYYMKCLNLKNSKFYVGMMFGLGWILMWMLRILFIVFVLLGAWIISLQIMQGGY